MLQLDLMKVNEIQSSLDGVAEIGLLIAIEEYISSNGSNYTAKRILKKLGIINNIKIKYTIGIEGIDENKK